MANNTVEIHVRSGVAEVMYCPDGVNVSIIDWDNIEDADWFYSDGSLTMELPSDCVRECSHFGDCFDDVKFWVEQLNFNVPVDQARAYLKGFGTWDDLEDCSEELLAQRVLWTACNAIKEDGEWLGLPE